MIHLTTVVLRHGFEIRNDVIQTISKLIILLKCLNEWNIALLSAINMNSYDVVS